MKWADENHTCHLDARFRSTNSRPGKWHPPEDTVDASGFPRIALWRTCDFCGSIHPGDLVELTKRIEFCDALLPFEQRIALPHMEMADLKYGYPHKVYVTTKEIIRPEQEFQHGLDFDKKPIMRKGYSPFIKFYTEHLMDEGIDEEAFASIAEVLSKHTGFIFERDEKGLKWKRRTA